ncbi:MAG: class I SAM-dependent methyltransferase [Thermoanaerobaculia bacterium]|nr:class I SAM-dependent methyltransferase [Thermoanaerobaculia bacterium]
MTLAYRDFHYPLNVFMHILTHEEGAVEYLHYGIFEREDEPIRFAQERSTEMLMKLLPPPPARILEVGIGIGTTLARLASSGYDAEGITPDEKQIATVRERHGEEVRVTCSSFETFEAEGTYDCLVFQESSQYIDSSVLFSKAARLSGKIVVLDEFALEPMNVAGSLHSLDRFLTAAHMNGYAVVEEVDLSARAAPTIDYFIKRIPQWKDRLVADLGVTAEQIDDLLRSGRDYREHYRDGTYGYRLMKFSRA